MEELKKRYINGITFQDTANGRIKVGDTFLLIEPNKEKVDIKLSVLDGVTEEIIYTGIKDIKDVLTLAELNSQGFTYAAPYHKQRIDINSDWISKRSDGGSLIFGPAKSLKNGSQIRSTTIIKSKIMIDYEMAELNKTMREKNQNSMPGF